MADLPHRRAFLKFLAAGSAAAAATASLLAEEKPAPPKTHVFKKVGDLEIKADVYQPVTDNSYPVVMWIHGGALIMGDRKGIDGELRDMMLKAGYAVVSIDYRLAPETKLPAILEDVQDAYRWVRDKGPDLFHIDPDRIAVMGGSAGGYLTQTTGFRVNPRPKALVSFWGYGDITNEWYSRPDAFYRKQPLVTKEEAERVVGDSVIAEPPAKNQRGRFYLYCRQQGLWPKMVAGHDPDKESKAFDPFCPIRNVTKKYPPTLFIHGTKDTDVPYQQSVDMAKELDNKGVEHELITIKDGGHGLGGVKRDAVLATYEKVIKFLGTHLR